MKSESSIISLYGYDIAIVKDEDLEIYVPIKSLCQTFGIGYPTQLSKIKNSPAIASTVKLIKVKAADGKYRSTASIQLASLFYWLVSFDFIRVKDNNLLNFYFYFRKTPVTFYITTTLGVFLVANL